uniref:Nucleoprotein n=1 Tax=Panagrolaimus sp. JU765 TaxID=591449 RepID=A0AC34RLX0_9BILA
MSSECTVTASVLEKFRNLRLDLDKIFVKNIAFELVNQLVKPKKIGEIFIERGGGKNTETFKDLCSLLGFMHKHGSKINKKNKKFSKIAPNRFKALIAKYNIKDNPQHYEDVTLPRLQAAFPLQNLKVAMKIKPRSFIEDVDYTLPHHWLAISGAASFIPKDSKYDPLMKIVVFYQNKLRESLKTRRVKNTGTMEPKEYCKLVRDGGFSDEQRIACLILAGILDERTKEVVEQVQSFANTPEVMATTF